MERGPIQLIAPCRMFNAWGNRSGCGEGYTGNIPFYRYRYVVRPGISGWAQVNQSHVAEVDDIHLKLQYDFFYINYFSPWLDILIVFRTIRTMLTGFGSK